MPGTQEGSRKPPLMAGLSTSFQSIVSYGSFSRMGRCEVRAFLFLRFRPNGTQKECVFSTRTVQTPCKTAGPDSEEKVFTRTLPLYVLTLSLPLPHPFESLVHSLTH